MKLTISDPGLYVAIVKSTMADIKPGKSDLKPGTRIFVAAGKKQADGSVQTPRVTYGKDGLMPPM
jgi:hypothetical protein